MSLKKVKWPLILIVGAGLLLFVILDSPADERWQAAIRFIGFAGFGFLIVKADSYARERRKLDWRVALLVMIFVLDLGIVAKLEGGDTSIILLTGGFVAATLLAAYLYRTPEQLENLDRRWIFLSVGLVVFVFLRIPLPVQYKPSAQTEDFYKVVDSVPSGSIVFLAADYGPSTKAEIYPMNVAVVERLLRHGVRIIAAAVWETGPPLADDAFKEAVATLEGEGIRKEYGIDYVNLGFKSGTDVALAKIGSSIREAYPLDNRGTPIDEIPIMDGVENFDQIALLCEFSAGNPGARQWFQQVQKRYHVRMIAGVTAVMAPDLYSFYQSKQLLGFLGGLVGAAEYEYLVGRKGRGMKAMNVQSLAHFLILGFILAGNVVYFVERRRRRG